MNMEQCKDIVQEICGSRPRNITTSFLQFVQASEKPKHLRLCALRNIFYYIIPSTTDDGTMIYMPWFWMFRRDVPVYFMLHEALHQQNPFASEEWVTGECRRLFSIWKVSKLKKFKKSVQGS